MRRCFDLAQRASKKVKSNPNVGALIVYKDKVIGEGYHKAYGDHHAEVNALASVKPEHRALIPNATMYVTLEPCCITSKTPPCSEAIIRSGIKKLVVSVTDPNPSINGKSIELLSESGIEVIVDVLKEKGRDLILPFQANLQARPYVILKYAQSKDGYIGKRGKQVSISNKYSQIKVHKWRSEVDGILIGYNTALNDDPQLSTRFYPGNHPHRYVIDPQLELPRSLSLWTDDLHTTFITEKEPTAELPPHKSCLVVNDIKDNIDQVLNQIYKLGVNRLMIEGGAKTIRLFLKNELWDEARIITSNTPLTTGIRAPFLTGRLVKVEEVIHDKISYIYRKH